jgi:hypothetical protein
MLCPLIEESIMWYELFLGNGVEAFAPSTEILKAFPTAFLAAGQPAEMAVFSRTSPDNQEVTLYFSPAAASLAKAYPNAVQCEKPVRKGLGLLVGEQTCWPVLFPKS